MKSESFRNVRENVSSSFIDAAYERAQTGVGQDQIDVHNFEDHYGSAAVAEDIKTIERFESIFASEDTEQEIETAKWATILEAIIVEHVELSEWLGSTTMTRRTSRFDDVVNAVDAIAEIENENATTHLALSIDVTFSETLAKKFARITKEIDEGTLATVKYFESSDRTFKGTLMKVPRIVLGVGPRFLVELAELWMQKKNKELAYNAIQLKFIEEVRVQLYAFRAYAQSLKNREDIVKVYDRQIRILGVIKKERYEALEKAGVSTDAPLVGVDPTFDAIVGFAKDIESRAKRDE